VFLRQLAPRSAYAVVASSPPVVEIGVVPRLHFGRLVQHSAQPTKEVSIDEMTRLLPLKVLIVEGVVLIEQVQVLGQLFGAGEVVYVDERVLRRVLLVVATWRPHHNGHHIRSQSVDVELFGDVIATVGVLESQIELVVLGEDIEAVVTAVARTALGTAATVDVDIDVVFEILGVLEPIVLGTAVGDEPGDVLGLPCGEIVCHGPAPLSLVVVDPLFVGRH